VALTGIDWNEIAKAVFEVFQEESRPDHYPLPPPPWEDLPPKLQEAYIAAAKTASQLYARALHEKVFGQPQP
jgi:hypothetical protein